MRQVLWKWFLWNAFIIGTVNSIELFSMQAVSPTGTAAAAKQAVLFAPLQRMAQDFKSDARGTQTESFLAQEKNIEKLDKYIPQWREPRYQKLLQQLIKEEKKHPDAYVFYHGLTKPWRVPQEFYKELYSYFGKTHPGATGYQNLRKKIKNFEFLRFDSQNEKTADKFIEEYLSTKGLIDDTRDENKAALLSVNYTPFGDVSVPGESTFNYFTSPQSHSTVGDWAFQNIAKLFDIDPVVFATFLPKLRQLDEKYLSPEISKGELSTDQVLLQIFVPKNMIDSIAYLSWRHGLPYQEGLIDLINKLKALFTSESKKPFETILDATHLISDKILENKESKLRKEIDKDIQKGAFKVSPFLESFVAKRQLKYLHPEKIQMRLLYTTPLLFNPDSGVEFISYDFISDRNKKAFQKELKSIVEKMAAEQRKLYAATKKSAVSA